MTTHPPSHAIAAPDLHGPLRILLIGSGEESVTLLRMLVSDPRVQLVGVADRYPKGPLMTLAQSLHIPTAPYYRTLLTTQQADLIIDATGDPRVKRSVREKDGTKTVEVISGNGLKLLLTLLTGRLKQQEDQVAYLTEFQHLTDLLLTCTKATTLQEAITPILEASVRITNTKLGNLATYDDASGEFELRGAIGAVRLSEAGKCWNPQPQDLSNLILSQNGPLILPDLTALSGPAATLLRHQGIRASLGIALRAHHRLLGILTVHDTIPHEFTPRALTHMGIITNAAALILEKFRVLSEIRREALTDGLTGLANHRYFLQQLHHALDRCTRYRRPVSLLLCDIDHFKLWNDSQGHEAGNVVLKRVAQLLKKTARQSDIVARYGGEEFVIIMPETAVPEALKFGERLRHVIASYPFPARETQPLGCVSMSFGLATAPLHATTAETLIERADQALYASKRAGRNRVSTLPISPPPPQSGPQPLPPPDPSSPSSSFSRQPS